MTFVEALRSPELKRWWPWIWSSLPILIALHYQAIAPVGHWALLFLEIPYSLGLIVAICGFIALPWLTVDRKRRQAWSIAAVIYLLLAIGGMFIGRHIRTQAFERLAEKSAPLVSAIRRYEKDHGKPPAALIDLVPAYLPNVPRTGMMAYPEYRYYVGEATQQAYDKNPWVLIVDTPLGFLKFDTFMYLPLQNYPQSGYGGSLQRVRDWAYVHE